MIKRVAIIGVVDQGGANHAVLLGDKGRVNFIAHLINQVMSSGIETCRVYRRQLSTPNLGVMPCNLCDSDASFNTANAHAIKQLAEIVKVTASHMDGISG